MSYFVGLDVSLDKTSICIVDNNGNIYLEGEAETDPNAIATFLQKNDLPLTLIGLEAGNLSSWLYTGLAECDLPVVCLETRHAKAALKAQNVKTDRNDARGLAQIVRTGWFKEVHIKSIASQKLRVLLNSRKLLLNKRLEIDGQIRGTLKVFGLKVGKVTVSSYEIRIHELIGGDTELEAYIYPLLAVRQSLLEQCHVLEKMVLKYVKHDEVCRRLMTIPGVGVLTALAFKTTIDNPLRFQKSKDVGAALGLTPRKYASGEIDYNGHITKCGDVIVRAHLYEAASVLLCRSKKQTPLRAWGMRIARRSLRGCGAEIGRAHASYVAGWN